MSEPILTLAGIEEESIVDGPGLRFVVFTQGCPHHCKGCQNPQTHPFEGGKAYSIEDLLSCYDENPLLDGMTFSGGEPFAQAEALAVLAEGVHKRGGTIVTYTGYTYETLRQRIHHDGDCHHWQHLLDETDLLIDGPYVEKLRDLDLLFRGSSNQRLLDKKSRALLDAQNAAKNAQGSS
ncbi:MAG: anaerobic ribonucleoside-triphosphate reductase activating protein [Desulfovibrio sp.]|nr:anaerobic ribonucleoside-triphosphate reductase activating protein [Desulfovibrio sp.]